MAGTDRSKARARGTTARAGPAIVLVQPQLGENIGAAARAMLNFGLSEMRLVRPRGDWPNQKALNTASGADFVVETAALHETTESAIADLGLLLATTARERDMEKPVLTPREAAGQLREAEAAGVRTGLLFGPERTGLDNEDVVRADALVIVPTNPAFASINLAQAVLLIAYEWFLAGAPEAVPDARRRYASAATQQELSDFFAHLETELDDCGFLHPLEKRPRMVRNIRNIFTRARLTDQEVRTLRGIVAGLSTKRTGR